MVADEGFVASPERLLGNIETGLDAITRTYSAIVRHLRAANVMQASQALIGKLPRAWLFEDLCLPKRTANQIVLLATYLGNYARTDAAFADGDIGFEHTVRIVRGLQSLPIPLRETVEPHLVEWARENPPEELGGFITELLDRLGIDSAAEARRQRAMAERAVNLTTTFAGSRAVCGSLTAEAAAIVEEALRVFDAVAGDVEDDRTVGQRNHDSLVGICRSYLSSVQVEPDFNGTPVGVIVTMPLEMLEGRLVEQAAMLLPSGAQIGPETARRLACDAKLIPSVLGTRSEVLDQGRATRDFTPAMRRAAYLEQRGRCAFPGCRRRVSDCHHIVWWRYGGRTEVSNAAWLCAFHHWLVHEGGWTLARDAARGFVWTSPAGAERIRHLQAA